MKIIDTTSDFAELTRVKKGCVLTVGNFDGVHLGHQEILAAARQTAAKRAAELIVMTFEPHPLSVLYPQKALGILTPLVLKKHLLAELGVDYFCIVKSTLELLNLSPREFVQQFIAEKTQPSVVVEGRSFNFGSDRAGNVDVLQKLASEMGFEVSIIKSRKVKLSTGQIVTVSSTVIRDLLASGRAANATIALGRPYR
ncbi:MAG: adenylyltransferase/cytidyltransferase family protein, partial [Phycisphaerae bacterium]